MSDPKRARCWDKTWKYVPKDSSDIRNTFARVRAEMQQATSRNVCPLTLKARKS